MFLLRIVFISLYVVQKSISGTNEQVISEKPELDDSQSNINCLAFDQFVTLAFDAADCTPGGDALVRKNNTGQQTSKSAGRSNVNAHIFGSICDYSC